MKRSILCSLMISLSLFSTLFAQQTISGSFPSNGQTRSYLGAVPDDPQTPLRLVILFCGAGENASQMVLRGFNNFLGNNTMVIYPEPFNGTPGFDLSTDVDDYQMVEDLITEVASNYTIDTSDICIGGFSNGGIFTYNAVCDFNSTESSRAYTFKAFAVVSGAMEDGTANIIDCPVSGTIPLIAFHGTQDPIIGYTGSFIPPPVNILTEPADTTLEFWATTINDCNSTPTVTALPDVVSETPNSTADLLEYNCTSSPNTVFYRINGGFHAWPGGNANLDIAQARNMDINASELIADFFENPTTVSTNHVNTDPGILSVYPNPVKDVLSIETTYNLKQVEIFNTIGKMVFASEQPDYAIPLDHLTVGTYFLRIETDAGTTIKKIIKN